MYLKLAFIHIHIVHTFTHTRQILLFFSLERKTEHAIEEMKEDEKKIENQK